MLADYESIIIPYFSEIRLSVWKDLSSPIHRRQHLPCFREGHKCCRGGLEEEDEAVEELSNRVKKGSHIQLSSVHELAMYADLITLPHEKGWIAEEQNEGGWVGANILNLLTGRGPGTCVVEQQRAAGRDQHLMAIVYVISLCYNKNRTINNWKLFAN